MTTSALPRWLRRLTDEWERTLLAALALAGAGLLVASLANWPTGPRGAGPLRAAQSNGRFRPAAFAFLEPTSWPVPASNPFAHPRPNIKGEAVQADPSDKPDERQVADDANRKADDDVTDKSDTESDPPKAGTRVFYHGCLRTARGTTLAMLTLDRVGAGRQVVIVSAAGDVADCKLRAFSPAAAILQRGTQEYRIEQGTELEVP